MKPIDLYKKRTKLASEMVQTTVSITKGQKRFVDENSLNLSEMTRDMLSNFESANETKTARKGLKK